MKNINVLNAKSYFFVALLISCSFFVQHQVHAQDIYANQMISHSNDFQDPNKITDANHTNYGYLSSLLNLLSTSYIKVEFPATGSAGDVLNVVVKGTGQVLGLGLLNGVTIKLYDSLGALEETVSGSNLLQLSLLVPGSDIYSIRFATSITSNYTFKSAKVEFNNVLTLNLLSELRVYSVFIQQSCPPILANGVHSYKQGGLLTSYVDNPSHAVSANQNDAAKMVVPLNLLGLLPASYLDLSFTSHGRAGEYVGFTIGEATSILDLALIQNINIKVYDDNNVLQDSKTGFSLLDLKLLPGSSNKYSIGFVTQSGNYNIARIRITLSATIALFEDLDVYNAFHYEIDRPAVTISVNGPTTFCQGGSVTLTAHDSLGATNYLWSNNATTQSITVTNSGTYYVQVSDTISCTRNSIPIQITVKSNPVPHITGDTILCHGITGTLSVPNTYASYTWSNNSNNNSINIPSSGTYYVTVASTLGCMGSDTIQVERHDLNIVSTIVSSNCSNTNSGSVSLNVSGGSGQYDYNWSNGSTNSSINNLIPGLYVTTISDNVYGCSYIKSYTVTANNTLSLKSSTINTSSCGESDGSIQESVVGGSGQYTYSWSNGANTANIDSLPAGAYVVTVTDQVSGCNTKDTVWLGDSFSDLVIQSNITPMSSCDNSNGKIVLNISGGSGSYTYLWSTGATTSTLNGLSVGIYWVLVRDNNSNCSKVASFEVSHSTMLNISGNITAASCMGSDGVITISVTGGSGNYAYHWSNGMNTASINNLYSGTYIVKVTDNTSGCMGLKTFTVKEAGGPTATLNINNPLCSSNHDGSINLAIPGNHYTFNWSNGETTKNLSNLSAGNYVVTITDTLSGCSSVYMTSLENKSQMNLEASVHTNTACINSANGKINIEVKGGHAPYTYSWSNNETTKNIDQLQPGNYTLTVSDANGCNATIIVPIVTDSSKLLKVAQNSISNASCNTATDGKALVNISGGNPPYNYLWSNGDSTKNLFHVTPGTYNLTVTDDNGCTAQLNVIIGMDTVNQLLLSLDSVVNTICADSLSGKIFVTTTGGQTPYDYLWSNGSHSEDLLNVAAGSYSLEVSDINGCTASLNADVNSAPDLVIDGDVENISCYGKMDGTISIMVNNGSGNYIYVWDNNSATTSELTGLAAGDYTVTVTDLISGCIQAESFTITEPDSLSIQATIVNDTCITEAFDGGITLNVSGGTSPYMYNWSNGSTTSEINALRAGIYTVTVSDQNQCNKEWSGEVKSSDCDFGIVIYDVITPNGDGANDNWVIKGLEFYPDNEVYIFDKWGDKVFEQVHYDGSWKGDRNGVSGNPLPDGTYFYLIKLNAKNKLGGNDTFTGSMLIQR